MENNDSAKISLVQKILLGGLYFLIVLMILFSVLALKDKGQNGYDKCVQKKCDAKGQDFCGKLREISNCCEGAGGKVGLNQDKKYVCVFS